ncbi:hypothetical protein JZ751_021085, partial [Albula glossodonta]
MRGEMKESKSGKTKEKGATKGDHTSGDTPKSKKPRKDKGEATEMSKKGRKGNDPKKGKTPKTENFESEMEDFV